MGYDWKNIFRESIAKVNQITVCGKANRTGDIAIYYLPFIKYSDGREAFVYFSWETTIFFYLMCSMKLVVHSRVLNGAIDQLERSITFQGLPMNSDINWCRSVEYLPKQLTHKYTILTAITTLETNTFFQFMSVFQREVWMALLLTLFVLSLLWSVYQHNNLDKILNVLNITGLILGQGIKEEELRKIKNSNTRIRNFSLVIWLSTWFAMASIMSNSFSGMITTNMFALNVNPIVESIEDLLENENVLIYTTFGEHDFEPFKIMKPALLQTIKNRIKHDSQLLKKVKMDPKPGHKDDELWAKGISEGKYVYLEFEGFTQNMRHTYSGVYPNLYLSDYKYYYDPLALIVGRKHKFFKRIMQIVRLGFECGHYAHQKLQSDMAFLGTFNTADENRKFSMVMEDKTLTLGIALRGSFIILFIFFPITLFVFFCEISIKNTKLQTKRVFILHNENDKAPSLLTNSHSHRRSNSMRRFNKIYLDY